MSVFSSKVKSILSKKNIPIYQLSKMIDYHGGALNAMVNSKKSIPKDIKERLLVVLEVPQEEFESWILADKYSKEILELAIQVKKDFPYKRKKILTAKIDEILNEKGISRTTLSKEINYSQSGLNRMIIGEINMSKPVIEKVANVLGISKNEILSWIIADKYSLELLSMAYSL